jgi:hypothetical protein
MAKFRVGVQTDMFRVEYPSLLGQKAEVSSHTFTPISSIICQYRSSARQAVFTKKNAGVA